MEILGTQQCKASTGLEKGKEPALLSSERLCKPYLRKAKGKKTTLQTWTLSDILSQTTFTWH